MMVRGYQSGGSDSGDSSDGSNGGGNSDSERLTISLNIKYSIIIG